MIKGEDKLPTNDEMQDAKTEEQVRWEVGEELCCLIGNLMLEDMEAGKLFGEQLREYLKYLKGSRL